MRREVGAGGLTERGGLAALVGREGELAELDATIGRLQRRLPQTGLEIVGEAGLGKSTLVAELEARAMGFGAKVLHGRASQFERDLPFGALRTALDGLPHGLGGAASALRHETHDRVRGLLSDLARDHRVVLVVDDLHWADVATLDLIGALIERPPRGAFLLVVAYRPHQRDGTLPPVIATAAARGALRRITPQPLDLGATFELLGTRHSRAEVTELHTLCGGNPYFLVETARAIQAGTWRPSISVGDPVTVPPLILGALITELLPLTPQARELLRAAAVLGDPFEIELAADVAQLAATQVAPAVDQLASAGLIRSAGGPRRFRFRHPLTREAIRDEVPVGSRRLAHGRAAAALTAAHAETSAIAHHVAQSAEQGDLEAVALLEAAGREILPRSPASAAEWLSTAWNLLLPEDRAALERQTLLYPLSVALSVRGRAEEALVILRQALAALPADSPEARRLVLGSATVEATTGGPALARRRLEAVLAEADAADQHHIEYVLMHRLGAVCSLRLGELDEAARCIARAFAEADRLGMPQLRTTCRPTAALIACLADDVVGAVELTEESDAEFAAIDDAMLPWLIDAYVTHVRIAVGMQRDGADDLIERGLRATADGLRPILAVDLLSLRAERALRAADITRAQAAAQATFDEAALLNDSSSRYFAQLTMGLVTAEREPGAAAIEATDQGVRAARSYGMPAALAVAGMHAAAARLAVGDAQGCRALIEETHGGPELPLATPIHRTASFALLARAALLAGDEPAARMAVEFSERTADGLPASLTAARRHALVARARLELRVGDARAALAASAQAASDARAAGAELEALEADIVAAQARARTGDEATAAEQLRALLLRLSACGAVRLQTEAEHALRPIDRRPAAGASPRPLRGAATLTARQRQVAELAAAGRSNREIAETLVLSVKTVESHLRAAFATLGAQSRPELRERLGDEGARAARGAVGPTA